MDCAQIIHISDFAMEICCKLSFSDTIIENIGNFALKILGIILIFHSLFVTICLQGDCDYEKIL